MFSWWSCEKFTERVSRDLDGTLPWHERPAYYFRLLMCKTSRCFRRQMLNLEKIASSCPHAVKNQASATCVAADDPDGQKLSDQACERIKAALKEAASDSSE